MSGLVVQHDLCAEWAPKVVPGWRGPWPCPGEKVMVSVPATGPGPIPVGLLECTCTCHLPDGAGHRMPKLSDRTAVHPTDVLGATASPRARQDRRPTPRREAMQSDVDHSPCPICGTVMETGKLTGHLEGEHHRDGGAPNPAPEVKAWPPQGIETK